ncbi:hypothetical protein UlMin_044274, partial [Ulmus minor]
KIFRAKSHRVYSIDLIGYGYSDKPNPCQFGDTAFYTFETWATQLNEFCKDEAFFIFNSIGDICKGIMLLNISLRMLHIKKQPWFGRLFIRSFQNLLRNTALGQYFFKAVATPETMRSILGPSSEDTYSGTSAIDLGRAYANFDYVEDFVVLPNVGHCPQDEAPSLVNPLVGTPCGIFSEECLDYHTVDVDSGYKILRKQICCHSFCQGHS